MADERNLALEDFLFSKEADDEKKFILRWPAWS
jgi:hypothetical protein